MWTGYMTLESPKVSADWSLVFLMAKRHTRLLPVQQGPLEEACHILMGHENCRHGSLKWCLCWSHG